MPSKSITWTPPSQIEGEPDEVAALTLQQLEEFATGVLELTKESYAQLRAEGLERHETLPDWENAPEGQCAAGVRLAGIDLAVVIRRLSGLSNHPVNPV